MDSDRLERAANQVMFTLWDLCLANAETPRQYFKGLSYFSDYLWSQVLAWDRLIRSGAGAMESEGVSIPGQVLRLWSCRALEECQHGRCIPPDRLVYAISRLMDCVPNTYGLRNNPFRADIVELHAGTPEQAAVKLGLDVQSVRELRRPERFPDPCPLEVDSELVLDLRQQTNFSHFVPPWQKAAWEAIEPRRSTEPVSIW